MEQDEVKEVECITAMIILSTSVVIILIAAVYLEYNYGIIGM